jgi:hypothetical protein
MIERDPLVVLRVENTRLIALLEFHGIEWRLSLVPTVGCFILFLKYLPLSVARRAMRWQPMRHERPWF